MISRFYFICYEVDAPLSIRHDRFTRKYQSNANMALEKFVALDDKIRYGTTDEFNLYSSDPSHQHMIRRKFFNNTNDPL